MDLAKNYSKELINRLQQIPVYLPGEHLTVGQVISFDKKFLAGQSPVGAFQRQLHLVEDLGLNISLGKDPDPDTYVYATQGGVSINTEASVSAGPVGKGNIKISFSKEGATYLNALNCRKEYLKGLANLAKLLKPYKDQYNWSDFFIVTSVTVAEKALIMQSNSNSAELLLNVETSLPGSIPLDKPLKADFSMQSYKDASFIKPWSDNVAVFMELVKFSRKKGDISAIHGVEKASQNAYIITPLDINDIKFE